MGHTTRADRLKNGDRVYWYVIGYSFGAYTVVREFKPINPFPDDDRQFILRSDNGAYLILDITQLKF